MVGTRTGSLIAEAVRRGQDFPESLPGAIFNNATGFMRTVPGSVQITGEQKVTGAASTRSMLYVPSKSTSDR
jgi:hypothetical protein